MYITIAERTKCPDAVSRLSRPIEPKYPVDEGKIPEFEDALFAVTTRSAAHHTSPDGTLDHHKDMADDSDDEHTNDGLHKENLEYDD